MTNTVTTEYKKAYIAGYNAEITANTPRRFRFSNSLWCAYDLGRVDKYHGRAPRYAES